MSKERQIIGRTQQLIAAATSVAKQKSFIGEVLAIKDLPGKSGWQLVRVQDLLTHREHTVAVLNHFTGRPDGQTQGRDRKIVKGSKVRVDVFRNPRDKVGGIREAYMELVP